MKSRSRAFLAAYSSALFCLFSLCAFSNFSHASVPKKELRWAADAKSGVPYVFVDPSHPKKMQGFELDIMEKLAEKMDRKLVFVQNEWDSLVPGLNRGDYDVAANGIEITPEREEQVFFSIPYYSTFEQLVVRADDTQINSIDDLAGKKTGTLKASLGHYILEKKTKAEIVFYEEENSGYSDVENGRIDAFFIDYPIALYYAASNKKLKFVGEPVGKMFYGIAVAKKNTALLKEINEGLKELFDSGDLEKILAKWNLLHPFTARELGIKGHNENETAEYQKITDMKGKSLSLPDRFARYATLLPILMRGALTSLEISMISMVLAIAFGLLLALSRLYGNRALAITAQAIIELLRGTPLLIQLYLIFFGLPYLGIHFTPFCAAIIGLGLNYGAYEAENYRAGIEAIPKSQLEAAQALALSPVQRFVYVIFPQAYRII